MIGRAPNGSYFSRSDWKGCAVTRCGTTAYEYVCEGGQKYHRQPALCHFFSFLHKTHTFSILLIVNAENNLQ